MATKDRIVIPSGLPQSYDQRLRWHSCENVTNEDIPPFACMQLKKPADLETTWRLNAEEDEDVCQLSDEGELVWYVSKPDDAGASRQDPAQFVFNGPSRIPKRRPNADRRLSRGRCHQDYPAQVLASDTDNISNWENCGPRSNSWWLHWGAGQTAFVKISTDATNPLKGGTSLQTIWVRPNRIVTNDTGAWVLGIHSANSESFVNWPGANFYPANDPSVAIATVSGVPWLTFDRAGLYQFGFHCTLYGAGATPRGTQLALVLWHRRGSDGATADTQYMCYRLEDLEEDQYGNIIMQSKENVAMSGPIALESGDGLALFNLSAVAVVLGEPAFWATRISEYDGRFPKGQFSD